MKDAGLRIRLEPEANPMHDWLDSLDRIRRRVPDDVLVLAWRLSRTGTLAQVDASRLQLGFVQGVALQFLNIKAWMLALTLSAGWVFNAEGAPASNPVERLVFVCLAMLFFAFSSNFTYAVVGSLLRHWLAQGQRLLWFNRALAVVLAATAAWMLRA